MTEGGTMLECRPAEEDDMMLIFEWANDPAVRAASFYSDPIPLDDHKKWFRKMLDCKDRHLLVVEKHVGNVPVGYFRFDEASGEVSVSVGSEHRGRGLGAAVISAGVKYVDDRVGPGKMIAKIKPGNEASARAFEKAGFKPAGASEVNGVECFVFLWTRGE